MSYDYNDYNNYTYLELNAIQRVYNSNNTSLIPILSSPNRNKHSNYFSHSISITQIDVCPGAILLYFIKYEYAICSMSQSFLYII